MRIIGGELFSCDKRRGISAANSFPAINSAEYQRRTIRQQPFFDLVRRRIVRQQPFLDLVRRRTVRQQPFLDLVRRRTIRQQSFSILSIGELFAGNLFAI